MRYLFVRSTFGTNILWLLSSSLNPFIKALILSATLSRVIVHWTSSMRLFFQISFVSSNSADIGSSNSFARDVASAGSLVSKAST